MYACKYTCTYVLTWVPHNVLYRPAYTGSLDGPNNFSNTLFFFSTIIITRAPIVLTCITNIRVKVFLSVVVNRGFSVVYYRIKRIQPTMPVHTYTPNKRLQYKF